MSGGWRVRRDPEGWLAVPPDGCGEAPRAFRTRQQARDWGGRRELLAEAVDVYQRLDRRSGEMLAAIGPGGFGDLGAPAALTGLDAFRLSLLLFRGADVIARLALHAFEETADG